MTIVGWLLCFREVLSYLEILSYPDWLADRWKRCGQKQTENKRQKNFNGDNFVFRVNSS
jgi:hypothetical protein